LAAPDPTNLFNLFGLLPFTPPEMLHLGVWPIIMGITMWLQMKMNPQPTDPVQQQVFAWMPVIFTFMLGSFPAGLVIYWAWNNLLSVSQQAFIMKRRLDESILIKNKSREILDIAYCRKPLITLAELVPRFHIDLCLIHGLATHVAIYGV
jgi:membrane protein insertase Oxa1/YidC/SpoIIIJ